jgi:GNAT superfamily N-acetyltransferase
VTAPGIRAYRPTDREAIRRIAFETGYMGDSIAWLWPDRESFADLITRYYTDQEPESIFVAEGDGNVLGYLTGCVDSARVRPRWPAHLHIDLLPEGRGRGLGRRLMEGWLARLRRVRQGAPHPAPGFRTREGRRRMHVQWMVRSCPS